MPQQRVRSDFLRANPVPLVNVSLHMDWRIYAAGAVGLIAALVGLYLLFAATSARPSAVAPANGSQSRVQHTLPRSAWRLPPAAAAKVPAST